MARRDPSKNCDSAKVFGFERQHDWVVSEACEITCTLDPPWVEEPQMMMKK